MSDNLNEHLPGVLNAIAGIGVLLISFFVEFRFPISKALAKPIGLILVVTGMAITTWAASHLKEAFLAEVEPRLNMLVRTGPYKFIRHPGYLGVTISLIGATITLRSWVGLIGVFLFFLPSEIYRAKLEERALARRFGDQWTQYAMVTGFLLPLIGKLRTHNAHSRKAEAV